MLKNITLPIQCFTQMRLLGTFSAKCLKYSKFGEPAEVLEICEEKIDEPKNNEVVVKILAAPINPADINTIQGRYPVKPKFPATGGNECVAEVMSIGPNVENLIPGNRVIAFSSGLGTWSSMAKYTEKDLMKISDKIGIAEAATMNVNPCTAYRMLKDFVDLKHGDTVIQNGANSAVGQAVHQLCKAWGIRSVGVVRDRDDILQLKSYLQSLGATAVLTQEELRTTDIFKKKLPKPKLGLNCVGGKSATDVTRQLDNKGVLVTYGGMSREPVEVPTGLLIFKQISFKGFWMTQWAKENFTSTERKKMFDELSELMENCLFKAPVYEMVPLNSFKEAVEASLNFKGFTGKKYILDLQN